MLTLQAEWGSLAQCQHWKSRAGSLGLTGQLILANRWAPRSVRDCASENKVASDQGTHPVLMCSHSTKEYTPSAWQLHTHGHINSYPHEHIHHTQTHLLSPSWTHIHTTHKWTCAHIHTHALWVKSEDIYTPHCPHHTRIEVQRIHISFLSGKSLHLFQSSRLPAVVLRSGLLPALSSFFKSFSIFLRLNTITPFPLSPCKSSHISSILPFQFRISFH